MGNGKELLLQHDTGIDLGEDGCIVEVGVGDSGEECIDEIVACLHLIESDIALIEAVADGSDAADDAQQ